MIGMSLAVLRLVPVLLSSEYRDELKTSANNGFIHSRKFLTNKQRSLSTILHAVHHPTRCTEWYTVLLRYSCQTPGKWQKRTPRYQPQKNESTSHRVTTTTTTTANSDELHLRRSEHGLSSARIPRHRYHRRGPIDVSPVSHLSWKLGNTGSSAWTVVSKSILVERLGVLTSLEFRAKT